MKVEHEWLCPGGSGSGSTSAIVGQNPPNVAPTGDQPDYKFKSNESYREAMELFARAKMAADAIEDKATKLLKLSFNGN